ncbi:sn-glycerol-3-phosphate import ATP-binding protein UgpC [Agrobacterium genomosp. 3]|uniref:Sn-glycerol-3-phosphate import ATP-binding protein UgpC n=2 Tax=Agrobacterium tumefaciens complex TaxID=1183400 RepID=A0AAE6BNJ2_AGRTU|nr:MULTISPECIES: sn-glycerol-3-phosphate import ATP-binding protein UgpC [Rhizobium/Agrobacterium group]MBP8940433.1 sn-glycerol-3-phosphate import ATP-binding protein UgpC [Agrobacterium sp.]MCA1869116.1 sn-glycerol-3-phosphate import ATP-binding protein UgpC [Agrobacterium tomkonis]MCA2376358.1 sn-glycerol-3-phosphate import ATP-binding protein UgpC [Agrobacterium tomkonis RTP8]KRA55222.1 glycerol-3-phosphate transporter ATP-binding subunit [Rhizobium sp. Root651]MCA1879473.1 sn-glycerol-3-p
MAKIALKDVRKVYGGNVDAIKGVSMDIADGEMIVLVGPSGCGKSTLLRMIAGLESISGGEIVIGDRVVNDLEPSDRDIAMVFQNYALYPHMTVRQNLAYGLKNRNTPKEEIERRITEAAKALEIEQFLERKPRQLSGGQRQRVAMGRAIVRKPAAFLFDEPLSNLDAKLRVQMRVEIRRLQRSLATTSVYVTHDQMEAMTLADRLVVLNAGRIEQMGTPIELYEKPATTFVATFIGSPSMNLLAHGAASSTGSTGWSVNGATVLPQTVATLGIRPEDITLATEAPADAAFAGTVQVDAVELVGAESYVHGSFADGTTIVFRVHGRSQLRIGETLKIAAQAKDFHLFDTTGKRI